MSEAPGKGLLKVTGILFIIWGLINAVITILGFAGVGAISSFLGMANNNTTAAGTIGGILTGVLVLMLIGALFEIIVGAVGVSNSEKPRNASICITLAVIMIILQLVTGFVGVFNWISIIGLLLPILYLIGAIRNRSSAMMGHHHHSAT